MRIDVSERLFSALYGRQSLLTDAPENERTSKTVFAILRSESEKGKVTFWEVVASVGIVDN